MSRLSNSLNVITQCREWRVPLFACPQFLFIIMGVVIITAMVGTNMLAKQYAAPEIAAIIVLFVTAFLFVVGYIITRSFERVAQASRTKAEFVSIISHQLRTPLTNIRWRLERMTGNDASFLQKENARIMNMVNTLLEVNRIEEKSLVLHKQKFSFRDLLQRTLASIKEHAQRKEITVEFRGTDDPLALIGDAVRLRWVVENLLDNALRYSQQGGRVFVTISRKRGYARVDIRDEGPGITKEMQKMLFTKFFRADEHIRMTTEGFGLGLFIAKAIVEAHEGSIGMHSQLHKGSTFWFTLPLSE
jgi:two-component system, OmpR family, phosphate regulon sensor histidine kinase PhoR